MKNTTLYIEKGHQYFIANKMKYHKQEHLYVPGTPNRGSCYPTVLACLLDLELNEVPYFNLFYYSEEQKNNLAKYYVGKDDLSYALNLWVFIRDVFLASRGYKLRCIGRGEINLKYKDIPYMATDKSSRGVQHIVICLNGKMIHDPHPSNEGIIESDFTLYEVLEKL